ncbi:CD109 antigen-like [Littorina saxatilis]|uniref:CD109 antigen-like n=1 Tax=Littorina saxatilis TaxID=31220 RepID=UPI0038B4506C
MKSSVCTPLFWHCFLLSLAATTTFASTAATTELVTTAPTAPTTFPFLQDSPFVPFPSPETTSTTTTTITTPLMDMTYWVSFSKRIRPGAPLAVSVFAPNATGPFTLAMNLMDYSGTELQKGQNFTLQATDEVQTVQFHIDRGITGWSMYIRALALGGEEFDGFERVYLTSKRLSVFIQTDKTTYLPGQTVRFRTLAMLPDLMVVDKPMDIVITDPHNNRIAQWLNVSSNDDTGVVQGEMVTSLFPPLGVWTIKTTVDGVEERKTFKLEEYELPQFEVKLKFPDYALISDEKVVGTITAKYTFGSPVKGRGNVVATFNNYWNSPDSMSLFKDVALDQNGEGEVEFTTEELKDLAYNTTVSQSRWYRPSKKDFSLDYRSFDFNITVTDDATDDVMSEKTSLTFYGRSMSLRFMPISPSSFKPGLPVTVFVEALQPDGKKPLVDTEGMTVTFNVTYHTPISSVMYPPRYYYWYWPRTEEHELFTKTVSFDKNGVSKLTIDTDVIPQNASSVSVHTSSGDSSTSTTLNPFTSPSNAFLQLKLKKSKLQVGKKVKLQARSNVEFGDYTYQVYSKNALVMSKAEQVSDMRYKTNIKFELTSAMTPVADVIVFFVTESGEMVVDKLSVAVDDISANDVSVTFVKPEVKPGKTAKLKVRASPRSKVFLLGVDKSVQLLGTGNDISREDVMSELVQYGSGNSYLLRGSWYFYDYSTDANAVFQGANAGIITDAKVPGKYLDVPSKYRNLFPTTTRMPLATEMPLPGTVMFAARQEMDVDSPAMSMNSGGGGAVEKDTPAERLRTFFPETWLWDTVDMKSKRKEVLKVNTPDTITTWVVTAFAVHPTLGLAVSRVPAELLAIKRLFATLDLPYSAVRGEDVCFTALTFNRYDVPVKVSITLAENATAFQNVLITTTMRTPSVVSQTLKSIKFTKDLGVMQPNSMESTVFCVRPHSLGDMPVTVFLEATKPADGLVKTFRIKPEGVERSQAYPVLIEIPEGEGSVFSSTVDVELPERFVAGSVRMSVALVGDVMGVVAENLEDLLKMPYGCGEQNMLNFAPNTYLISYLNQTGRLTPAILTKAKNFMVSGYQRQLQYQHGDGSFSAFGNSDKSGSMWLTAFVVKCFVQAADLGTDVITIDPSVVNQAVVWMTRYQNKDGSFREPGKVFHEAMQGGSAEGLALTAYVTIALKEAQNRFSSHMSTSEKSLVNSSLTMAVAYLEDQMTTINDTYTTCIVAYALTLTGSSKAMAARQKMQQRATVGDTMKYWSGPVEVKQTYYMWYRKTDAISIEMTSYALLTLMHEDKLQEAIPVFRWMNKQRGPKGGFISTQDTVLGVEALATMADLALGDNFSPIHVRVTWRSTCQDGQNMTTESSLTIDEKSVLLLQKMELPIHNDEYPDQVTISATSAGARTFALAEVVVYYNMDTSTVDQAFSADTTLSNNTVKSFVLTTCVRRNSDNASQSMVVAEIGVPSGYEVVSRQSDFGKASRFDLKDEQTILYYSSVDSEGDCSMLKMKMSKGVVANSKPASVRVYDYYNPDEEFTTSYSLKQFGVCDLEPEYMLCPYIE